MRLTGLLLTVCLMSASAEGLAQRISVTGKQLTLKQVFEAIERQTDYVVLYSDPVLQLSRPVAMHADKMPLDEFLSTVFAAQPQLSYGIKGKSIFVIEKPAGFTEIAQQVEIQLTDSAGHALPGATVHNRSRQQSVITGHDGRVTISVFPGDVLVIRYIGHEQLTLKITETHIREKVLRLQLKGETVVLRELAVVATGYQEIPQERVTGSFTRIGRETIERSTGMSILSRLEGVSNGLLLDRNAGNPDQISIRGRSTIFSNTRPLIILDNFPYEGDINLINPNDIESVTLLKDATAASIWGVRSANGVIVITTKKAKRGFRLELSTNLGISAKPDVYYTKQMTSAEYVDAERRLFALGEYDRNINNGYSPLSPVVELLAQVRAGRLQADEADRRIAEIAGHDVRDDLDRYFYRKSVQQQHLLTLSSGGEKLKNIFSIGYDRGLNNRVDQRSSRFNLRSANEWTILGDRLKANLDVLFSQSRETTGNAAGYMPRTPYAKLAENGAPLEVMTLSTLRSSYTDTAGQGLLLDWKYRPLDEMQRELNRYDQQDQQLRIQGSISSRIYRSFEIKVSYLHSLGRTDASTLYDPASFYVRDLVNQYSQVDHANRTVQYVVPKGAILNESFYRQRSQYGRIQLNWDERLGTMHRLGGMIGAEWRHDEQTANNPPNLYGYDAETESQVSIDDVNFYEIYHTGFYSRLTNTASRSKSTDRNRSVYALLSYDYNSRLMLTASARKDESNIFGVASNQRGVPLWSLGAAYNLHTLLPDRKEVLDYLKLRTTFGYNGNVDKNTTAFLTSKLDRSTSLWNMPIDVILNPPNSTLRWERVQNMNIGMDFSLWNGRVGGVAEYYIKNGKDLMGYSPVAPQTGVVQFYGNVAATHTAGLDMQLWYNWTPKRAVRLRTDLILNISKDRVTEYYIPPGSNTDIVSSLGIVPIEGYPINALVMYAFEGLNDKGDPLGRTSRGVTDDWGDIQNGQDRNSIVMMGSKVPVQFGSLRNTISWKQLELSFNLLFKFGYYFKRTNSFYTGGLIGGSYQYSDYALRWQQPGDELHTTVPAFLYPDNVNRNTFYQHSTVLGLRGDHIRFQDIRLAYDCQPRVKGISGLQVYAYLSNLGIIWRKNSQGLDPHVLSGYPVPLQLSIGARAHF
ncbi:SusC/RagA family TonB-linked outer membrane protein [Chitinophaga cymbidii]|nr:SusC/RagA family TonB-linked outer membrane protein [Chitinophaga cymbidii]